MLICLVYCDMMIIAQAYDRLVVPERLVTAGPYSLVQHPVYTSYIMLFCGYALLFSCIECCLLFAFVCTKYYRQRTAIEAALLEQAFGNEYKVYREHTGAFLPRLL